MQRASFEHRINRWRSVKFSLERFLNTDSTSDLVYQRRRHVWLQPSLQWLRFIGRPDCSTTHELSSTLMMWRVLDRRMASAAMTSGRCGELMAGNEPPSRTFHQLIGQCFTNQSIRDTLTSFLSELFSNGQRRHTSPSPQNPQRRELQGTFCFPSTRGLPRPATPELKLAVFVPILHYTDDLGQWETIR